MFEQPAETPSPETAGSTRNPPSSPSAQPGALAQQLGVDGMLERFFAVSLDTRTPRYSPVSEPGLLEARALRAVQQAERAQRENTSSYGNADAMERRAHIQATEQSAVRARDDSATARDILTRARGDYARMVNTDRRERRSAALEAIAHIEEADAANARVLTRMLDSEYRDLTGAARAAREGTLPYTGPRPYTPYDVPAALPSTIATPGESRRRTVAATQEAIVRDLQDMREVMQRSASGNIAVSTSVSPLVVEAFLKTLHHDMQDGVLKNNPRAEVNYKGLDFVPLDRRNHPVTDDVAAGIGRLEKALRKPGGTEVDEALARDIENVSKMLTGKAGDTAAMQGPASTPAAAAPASRRSRRP